MLYFAHTKNLLLLFMSLLRCTITLHERLLPIRTRHPGTLFRSNAWNLCKTFFRHKFLFRVLSFCLRPFCSHWVFLFFFIFGSSSKYANDFKSNTIEMLLNTDLSSSRSNNTRRYSINFNQKRNTQFVAASEIAVVLQYPVTLYRCSTNGPNNKNT